jgi:hypothetical protein
MQYSIVNEEKEHAKKLEMQARESGEKATPIRRRINKSLGTVASRANEEESCWGPRRSPMRDTKSPPIPARKRTNERSPRRLEGRTVRTAVPGGGGGTSFPWPATAAALPPAAGTLEMLPSATRFLGCAGAAPAALVPTPAPAPAPAAASGIAGRLAVAEDARRDAAKAVDIVKPPAPPPPRGLGARSGRGGSGDCRRTGGGGGRSKWRGVAVLGKGPCTFNCLRI